MEKLSRSLAGITKGVAAAIVATAISAGTANAIVINPFADIVGKWSGSGLMTMKDGSRERIACNAEHSGNSLQLRLIINCVSGERDIRMLARLSSNAGRLLGFWEEKYFKAAGAITGIATENKISFTISGNVNGKMIVTYTKNRQNIDITTRDVTLQSLEISMRRR